MFSVRQSTRSFSTSGVLGKAKISIVEPVHHKVKIDKARLSDRFPNLHYPEYDVRSPKFKPRDTHADRLEDYYLNTIAADQLLLNYVHGETRVPGAKVRPWSGESPYHLFRKAKKPKGFEREQPDVKPHDWRNIGKITSVTVNCFVQEATENPDYHIQALLMLQQITGVGPKVVYAKENIQTWKMRRGMKLGGKADLFGRDASQFLTTLSELVLPRVRGYKGITKTAGDGHGNVSFHVPRAAVSFFPEIEYNMDNFPVRFPLNVTVNTSAQTDGEARSLLSAFGFLLQK